MKKRLSKSTIIIWADPEYLDVTQLGLTDLAREADIGMAYCSHSDTVYMDDPQTDPDWDGTEFFEDESIDEGGEEEDANN